MRKLDANVLQKRVETGALQIGDDWPGVFISGDNAIGFAVIIDSVLQTSGIPDILRNELMTLRTLLKSCNVNESIGE